MLSDTLWVSEEESDGDCRFFPDLHDLSCSLGGSLETGRPAVFSAMKALISELPEE